MASQDITTIGARFSRLVVIGEPFKQDGRYRVLCRCDCGNELSVRCLSLANANTSSCGCLHKESVGALNRKHGMSKSPTYVTYLNMVNRCTDSTNKKFADYGGRGIGVCDGWIESFEKFLSDMGVRPSNATLERIDLNGNYEPSNCKWATWKEQQNNKRSNRVIEHDGQVLTLQQWADKTNLSHSVIFYRLKRGWSIEKALTTPAIRGKNQFN